ncbi:TPA: bifunctional transcriptional regulator/O-phospho-L-serine synthase SbnI [Staphylococcus aureus]|nr:bifunctional transcriptional regulator/O-phospho-L-serine synthase SbnI [Staphylococcus aureus]HDB4915696.1 bifunctional transcriptional regulator/O-phospho-L-serine synthase SbnI [Staphylococcus aureus]HDB4933286.1 bifunctional transcriptional regulator/O-phospho-L-serine synthase SbnI [Staphylococcus aureus]HDF7695717.1 bifunctional transcriptional regulator/O-phospho-L-serine synthase SbnI [Staphylococcus aureus]HDF7697342.1 bifunctional transcriptional regulator/O-phospho-L-serine syntha
MNHIHEHLKLVPVDKIDLHETFEPLRLEKTKSSIEADDFIRHPILVTAMQHGRYMVIDGVHRYTSLKALGCKKVPVQEIHETQYSISTWQHKVPFGVWWETLQQEHRLPWTTETRQEAPFITMCHGDTEQYLYTKDLGETHFQVWEKVVASYSGCCSVERIAQGTYPCLSQQDVLMKYQPLSYKEIEAVVHKGETVPAGVTRFNISGRCLNLQVPLALLKQDDDVEQLRNWKQFLADKFANMRCYTEKVYLVEQ